MNVEYMNELPHEICEHKETKTSKLLTELQKFMERSEPIMEVHWKGFYSTAAYAAATLRGVVRSNSIAMRVIVRKNRMFIIKEGGNDAK